MSKDKEISKLKQEYECEDWKKADVYLSDFTDFIVNEIVSHMSVEGIKKLTKYFATLNQQERDVKSFY